MSIKEKLPLINSNSKKIRIIGYVVYVWVALIILAALFPTHNTSTSVNDKSTHTMKFLSVDVGGWNFTANLTDQWRSNPNSPFSDDLGGTNSENFTYLLEHGEYTPGMTATLNWKGVTLANSFYLPKEGVTINSQKIPAMDYGKKQNDIVASVDISVRKIPNEISSWTTHDLLYDALGIAPLNEEKMTDVKIEGRSALLLEDYVAKDVAINGPPTMLAGYTFDTLEILMPDNTVSTIFVTAEPDSGISASDVINTITFKLQ